MCLRGPKPGAPDPCPVSMPRYALSVERTITGFHHDDAGDWVAELSCGHNQHVRHEPPFRLRAWVLENEGRTARLGTPIDCSLCDRAELPDGLRLVRTSPEWTEHTVPAGLLRSHRVASGTWGRIAVHAGRLLFTASTDPSINVALMPGSTQAVPPAIEHEVRPLGVVRFTIDFLAVDRHRPLEESLTREAGEPSQKNAPGDGGDPACWAGLLCPECGAVLDGGPHGQGCSAAGC